MSLFLFPMIVLFAVFACVGSYSFLFAVCTYPLRSHFFGLARGSVLT